VAAQLDLLAVDAEDELQRQQARAVVSRCHRVTCSVTRAAIPRRSCRRLRQLLAQIRLAQQCADIQRFFIASASP
jgi:hypothetical protein